MPPKKGFGLPAVTIPQIQAVNTLVVIGSRLDASDFKLGILEFKTIKTCVLFDCGNI
jgi:hypothetical protein